MEMARTSRKPKGRECQTNQRHLVLGFLRDRTTRPAIRSPCTSHARVLEKKRDKLLFSLIFHTLCCSQLPTSQVPFSPATENHPIVVPIFIVFRHWRFPGIHTLRCPCDINRINHTRATMGQQGVITVLTATMTRDFYFYWPRTTCVSAPLSSQGIEYLTSRADIVSARSIVRFLVKIFLFDGSPPLEKPNTISFDSNLLIFNKPRVLSSLSRGWLSMWAHSSHPIEDGRGVWFFPPRNLSVVSGSSPPQRIQQPVGFSSL